jgi:hypothetical protein
MAAKLVRAGSAFADSIMAHDVQHGLACGLETVSIAR